MSLHSAIGALPDSAIHAGSAGAAFWRWKRFRRLPLQYEDRLIQELALTAKLTYELIDVHGSLSGNRSLIPVCSGEAMHLVVWGISSKKAPA
jgi:hypothetical protein